MSRSLSHSAYLTRGYVPVLDVVRAFAVLSVVTFHLGESSLRSLQAGVIVFFVLSGYLITTLALREESRRGALDVRAFIIRRAFRILPLYFLVLTLYCVLVLVLHGDNRPDVFRDGLPYFIAYFQEWPVFHAGPDGIPFGVSWSLGIEEKFYVVWPLLAFVVLRARSYRPAVAGLVALGFFAVAAAGPIRVGQLLVFYVPILVGAVLAFLLHNPRTYARLRALGEPRVLYGLLGLTAVSWLLDLPQRADFLPVIDIPAFVLPVALALGGLVTAPLEAVARMSPRALVHVGKLSYALYLTHQLFLNAADRAVPDALTGVPRGVVVLGLGLPPALVFCEILHRAVEAPLIRIGHRLGRPRPIEGVVSDTLPRAERPAVSASGGPGRPA